MKEKRQSSKQGPTKTKQTGPKILRDILEVIIPAFLIFLVVRGFVIETRTVPTQSMVPTINIGDRFLEYKLVYRFREPKRGEIVVFDPPAGAVDSSYKGAFVKRVVGLPGETVDIRQGKVYIDGKLLPEPYVPAEAMDYLSFGPYNVPAGHIFTMGDNRRESRDSRYWGFVPIDDVSGKGILRIWPLTSISVLR